MPLLLTENDTFEIVVRFVEQNREFKFFEPGDAAPQEVLEERFVFRWPNWSDTKMMMMGAISVDEGGETSVDPYKFMDGKIRILIKDWSLKDGNGEKYKINDKNIDKLHPALFEYLNRKIETTLSGKFQSKPEISKTEASKT
jgi:hypothetical protein